MSLEIIRKKIPSPKFAAKIQQKNYICKKNGDFCHFFYALQFAITGDLLRGLLRLIYDSFSGYPLMFLWRIEIYK